MSGRALTAKDVAALRLIDAHVPGQAPVKLNPTTRARLANFGLTKGRTWVRLTQDGCAELYFATTGKSEETS